MRRKHWRNYPRLGVVLVGLIFIKITKKYLYKITGIIRDESYDPLKYADVELFEFQQDAESFKKPKKGIFELENRRFEFSFLDKSSDFS